MSEGVLSPAPSPPVPERLSPSRYSVLCECGLRYAWEAAREPARLPLPPAVRLGSVVHSVYEQAERGQIEATTEAFREFWKERVKETEERMASSWLERHFIPLQRSVRHYEEARLLAIDQGVTLARQAQERTGGRGSGLAPEAELQTPDGRLVGQIDATISTSEGDVIRDYKTGRVYEVDEEGGESIKPAYLMQLRLYAVLYEGVKGNWPSRLELVGPRGEVIDVPFTPSECAALCDEAFERLDQLAESVRSVNEGQFPLETLGSPGEACRGCPYRPVCPAYRIQPSEPPPDRDSFRTDVWGIVQSVRPSFRGLVVLELERENVFHRVLDLDPAPKRNPALSMLQPGDWGGAFDVYRTAQGNLVATDSTIIYKLDQAPNL